MLNPALAHIHHIYCSLFQSFHPCLVQGPRAAGLLPVQNIEHEKGKTEGRKRSRRLVFGMVGNDLWVEVCVWLEPCFSASVVKTNTDLCLSGVWTNPFLCSTTGENCKLFSLSRLNEGEQSLCRVDKWNNAPPFSEICDLLYLAVTQNQCTHQQLTLLGIVLMCNGILLWFGNFFSPLQTFHTR